MALLGVARSISDVTSHRAYLMLLSNSGCYRYYCAKSSKSYSNTIILPTTTLPLWCGGEMRIKQDSIIRNECNVDDLYEWQSKQPREKTFVLHDGPPYANGQPHIGHAVNKILKDITNRYKLLRGYKIHYVPGWDCHGLPIELKASATEHNHGTSSMSTEDILQVRRTARTFAEKASNEQMAAFRHWGVMANWKNCYYTYNADYIEQQFLLFHQLYEKGLIYREFKPVFWSYATRTALAEAELEYHDHTSTALYFQCKVKNIAAVDFNKPTYALIWTTTPWTIPCNQAICYAADKRYSIVSCDKFKNHLLIASETKDRLEQQLSTRIQVEKEFQGGDLQGGTYSHPLSGAELPFLPAKHVTVDKGSGLVHAAPAHGPEDFLVAMAHKLSFKCLVDEEAKFDAELGPELAGKFVLKEGSDEVIRLLGENALYLEQYVHKYPYDWRSKQPVILRASKQWFIDTSNIKDIAVRCLQHVKVHPEHAKKTIITQLVNRPYWCISRQRVWGVPIPVFYNSVSGEAVFNRAMINHFIKLLHKHGADFWWKLPDTDLLPDDVRSESGFDKALTYHRGKDILDIWFDSGSSWASVLKDGAGVADVFLEGLDQIGGWFQSTLLTSCAVRDKAPYKSLYIHGFTVDEDGKKMSKSLGNVIDPALITDGGKDFKTDPPYGVDTLRWWVAVNATATEKVPVIPRLLKMSATEVQKIRGILRYLLGILSKFEPELHALPIENLLPLDRYMLGLLFEFNQQITEAYDAFSYSCVVTKIIEFISRDVSGLFCHIIKDRLYCAEKSDVKRLSSLTVANHIFEVLVCSVAPILPFLSEEVYIHHPIYSKLKQRVFQRTWHECHEIWADKKLAAMMVDVLQIREDLIQNATSLSQNLQNLNLEVASTGEVYEHLKKLQTETTSTSSALCEILQVAEITLAEDVRITAPSNAHLIHGSILQEQSSGRATRYSLALLPTKWFRCPRCRKYASGDQHCLCSRCSKVVASLDDK